MKKILLAIIIPIAVIAIIALSIRTPETESMKFSMDSGQGTDEYQEGYKSRAGADKYSSNERRGSNVYGKNEASNTNVIIDNQKLWAFAKAYVEVQSYMNKVGSKASYKKTSKLVERHGLSIDEYTQIAVMINKNPQYRDLVQRNVNKIIGAK